MKSINVINRECCRSVWQVLDRASGLKTDSLESIVRVLIGRQVSIQLYDRVCYPIEEGLVKRNKHE